MSKEELTMAEVAAKLESISQTIEARDELDAERRKVDDERDAKAERGREELRDRLDKHGTRTTALETNWQAFFGPMGAFATVVRDVSSLTKSMGKVEKDVAGWNGAAAAIKWGIPIIITLILAIIGFFIHEKTDGHSMIAGDSNVVVARY